MKCGKKQYLSNGGYIWVDCECCIPDDLIIKNGNLKHKISELENQKEYWVLEYQKKLIIEDKLNFENNKLKNELNEIRGISITPSKGEDAMLLRSYRIKITELEKELKEAKDIRNEISHCVSTFDKYNVSIDDFFGTLKIILKIEKETPNPLDGYRGRHGELVEGLSALNSKERKNIMRHVKEFKIRNYSKGKPCK